MSVRIYCYGLRIMLLTVFVFPVTDAAAEGDNTIVQPPKGTQSATLIAGPFFPIRVTQDQSTKLFGAATALSSSFVITDPIGSAWYQGQVSLGAELLGFSTTEPIGAYGIGLAPKAGYTFIAFGRLLPYVEGGGGPMWTDLGGRVPEQPGQFNFLVWGGGGCSWALTRQWAVQAGYRFMHISNANTREPNSGLNFGLPYVGLSYSVF
jgi:hypothetical protein